MTIYKRGIREFVSKLWDDPCMVIATETPSIHMNFHKNLLIHKRANMLQINRLVMS